VRHRRSFALGPDVEVHDFAGLLVLPGAVDVHTHLDSATPTTPTVDDFAAGTLAAAFGGTTTVVDYCAPQRGQGLLHGMDDWHRRRANTCVNVGAHMADRARAEGVPARPVRRRQHALAWARGSGRIPAPRRSWTEAMTNLMDLRIEPAYLLDRLAALGAIGDTGDGGCCRLALTDADRCGRDLVTRWMRELGLSVHVDPVGNLFGWCAGNDDGLAPVMTGSHIDTVATGGRYDGNYGVLSGLAVVQALAAAGVTTRRPLVVAAFTNEEGARFQPDMLGSLVFTGGLPLSDAHATRAIDGAQLGDELRRIGYLGTAPLPLTVPHAYVELHIEQGPVLDAARETIGAVRGVQGISWQAITVGGQANHAGTTPMRLRHDAGHAAAAVACFVRELALRMRGDQVATVGSVQLQPGLINVIARRAELTVDLRNTSDALLREAESRLAAFLAELARAEGVTIETRTLARFEPVHFDPGVIDLITRQAKRLGHEPRTMSSGAGHDAQMLARVCPAAMIFVPSVQGISHNPAETTAPEHLVAGADVLLQTLLELAS
jgi:N-carbamoyl-L-amino-acid hydrolase